MLVSHSQANRRESAARGFRRGASCRPTGVDKAVVHRIAITAGEPAGIGPDLCVQIAQREHRAELVVIADPQLLAQRAERLGLPLKVRAYEPGADPRPSPAGELICLPEPLAAPCVPGRPDIANSPYVIQSLARAVDGCLAGEFQALTTGPVNKAVIARAGIAFSGHTEWLAARTGASQPVMMLTAPGLRVALVTTHLPLRDVPRAITRQRLAAVLQVLQHDLLHRFAIAEPHILVLGLNPHAGEQGQLGEEEIRVITPVMGKMRRLGMRLEGPLPADTAFTPPYLSRADAILAMYHDQGLPVLKHLGFARAVNVTLGLPIIRTSVDHGTAFSLAGTGKSDPGSLHQALDMAVELAERARSTP